MVRRAIFLMSQGHIAIQNGKDTIIYGKDSRMEDSPIVKIEKAGEMVGNVQPILVLWKMVQNMTEIFI